MGLGGYCVTETGRGVFRQEWSGGLGKMQTAGSHPQRLWFVGPGRQRICISNKLSCDADANANAAGPEITLENHWSRTTLSTRNVM